MILKAELHNGKCYMLTDGGEVFCARVDWGGQPEFFKVGRVDPPQKALLLESQLARLFPEALGG